MAAISARVRTSEASQAPLGIIGEQHFGQAPANASQGKVFHQGYIVVHLRGQQLDYITGDLRVLGEQRIKVMGAETVKHGRKHRLDAFRMAAAVQGAGMAETIARARQPQDLLFAAIEVLKSLISPEATK